MNLEKSYKIKKIFYFVVLLSILPFIFLFFDKNVYESNLSKAANITGFIGSVIIIWQFFLGIRGVIKRLNPDYDWAMKIHAYFGIYGTIFVFLHPILLAIDRSNSFQSMVLLNFSNTYQTYVSYGKIGLYLFIVLWFTSAVVRKSLNYRSWLYIHYVSYPMLFFVLLHPLQIGSYLQEYSLIYNYWLFLITASFVFMVLKLADIFNLSSFKYKIKEIKQYPGDIFTIKYTPINERFLKIKPGQYFYIKKDFIGESHPFSILEYNDDTGEIIFGIKKLGKYSAQLGTSKVGEVHYIDWPFGEFTFEGHNNSPKVILAGGIGITPFYEVLSQFGTEDSYLFYANKNTDSALYRDKFKEILKSNYFDFVEQKEGDKNNVFCELISAQKIKQLLQHRDLDELKYFICGSPGFTKTMINCLQTLGIKRGNIYIEEFEY